MRICHNNSTLYSAIQNFKFLLHYEDINILFMSDTIDDRIIIEEPPIEKLNKKRSLFKRSCFNACGCLVLIIVFSLLFLKFEAKPKEKLIAVLPEQIKQSIPLYDPSQIASIYYNAGQERQKRTELLTFFPKLIVSPFVVHFPHRFGDKGPYTSTSTKKEIFYGFMRTPIGEQKDVYTLQWKNLPAEPQFIAEYYKTEMENANFILQYDQKNGPMRQMLYTNSSTLVNVIINDQENARRSSTDNVTLTISL